jgi:hypothetical protein
MNYRYPVLSLDELRNEVHEALWRYVAGLSRRTGLRWHVYRISKPTTVYLAVLVGPEGERVKIHYSQSRTKSSSRWKAEHTRHVIKAKRTQRKRGRRS